MVPFASLRQLKVIQCLASVKIGVICLVLLFALTFWGTLYQVNYGLYAAQHVFFYSWIVWVLHIVPLPGAQLVMTVLFVNILSTTLFKLKYRWRQAGLILVHFGILLLLIGGFITYYFATESFLSLKENEQSDVSLAYHDWELAVWKMNGLTREVHAIDTVDLHNADTVPLAPLMVTVKAFYPHSERMPTAPGTARRSPNNGLRRLPPSHDPQENVPGGIFLLQHPELPEPTLISLYGLDHRPYQITLNGAVFNVALQLKRYKMPFSVKLLDFRRTMYPGTSIAKSYESDVYVMTDRLTRKVRIYMNNPLRHENFTLFQSSFKIGPDGTESSTFAVVENSGRLLPYIACTITVVGMVIHFLLNLIQYARRRNVG